MPDLQTNVLYWGDNLPILRNHDYFSSESVDLVYLDPPFNSNASYNVLFKEPTGERSTAQLQAFSDTWEWNDAAIATYAELHSYAPQQVQDTLDAFHTILVRQRGNAMMAYLVMMTARLLELHRVLKPTGSLYLHCDPTASHYLKVILDTIFGPRSFRNEIVWQRTHSHNDPKRYGRVVDTLLFYTKSQQWTWRPQYRTYSSDYVASSYRKIEPGSGRAYQEVDLTARKPGGDVEYEWKGIRPYRGRYWAYSKENMEQFEREGRLIYRKTGMPRLKVYLDEMPGTPAQSLWDDIEPVKGKERLGYDTQKPLALLERIIQASSNEGDVVLDPFCGCGTAVIAAHKLNRRWIGIDVTTLAITVMRQRLENAFPGIQYRVIGEPTTLSEARALAHQEPEGRYQFQWWAVGLIGALPASDGRKKGADQGVDGFFSVHHDNRGRFTRVVVQVKSGHVAAHDIRDLRGVIGSEQLGVFITLEPSTEPMRAEASAAGLYHNPLMSRHYPRIQIITIEELLAGKGLSLPPKVQGPRGPLIGQQVRQGSLVEGGGEEEKPSPSPC